MLTVLSHGGVQTLTRAVNGIEAALTSASKFIRSEIRRGTMIDSDFRVGEAHGKLKQPKRSTANGALGDGRMRSRGDR